MDKSAIYARALEKHSKTGRVIKALDKIFGTQYPPGTNLLLKFMEQFIGMKYGHINMCMDKAVDCAELPRIAFYIFFGIDIGKSSHSQYRNKAGKVVAEKLSDLPKCRPLTLAYYDTDNSGNEDHVTVVYDSERIIQSGASRNTDGKRIYGKVAIMGIMWHPVNKKGHFLLAKDFLSDEQHNSVIVKGDKGMYLKKGDKGVLVERAQRGFISIGAGGDMDPAQLGDFGTRTQNAVDDFREANGLPRNGIIDDEVFSLISDKQSALISAQDKALADYTARAGAYRAANMKASAEALNTASKAI